MRRLLLSLSLLSGACTGTDIGFVPNEPETFSGWTCLQDEHCEMPAQACVSVACVEGECIYTTDCDCACQEKCGELADYECSCGGCECGEECLAEECVFTACDGLSCGDDGCGGTCGSCGCGEDCLQGECVFTACDGLECGSDGCGGTCGTCLVNETCSVSGLCECVELACAGTCCAAGEVCHDNNCCPPDCAGKSCGDDDCGGDCGSCAAGEFCDDGSCEAICTPDCMSKQCGSDGCDGSCGSCGAGKACASDSQCYLAAQNCLEVMDCVEQCGLSPSCIAPCVEVAAPGAGGLFEELWNCVIEACGPEPTGSCLEEAVSFVCVDEVLACGGCEPDCAGKECGTEGVCGVSCGNCAEGSSCLNYQCISDDPCFNNNCDDDNPCTEDSCVDGDCLNTSVPDGQLCGGGVCLGGICCTPDCAGKSCGFDGCNGDCGQCAAGYACEAGSCVEKESCGNETCEAELGETCATCPVDCGCTDCGVECYAGDCVFTACDGKECGSDGCGEVCGSCDADESCVENNCVQEGCTSNCSGKECGSDGCDGSCGKCSNGEACMLGTCEPNYVDSCVYGVEGGYSCVDDTAIVCSGGEYRIDCHKFGTTCEYVQAFGIKTCSNCGTIPAWSICDGDMTLQCPDDLIAFASCEVQGGVCIDGECCSPDCDGKECGSDGCGGLCNPGCGDWDVCTTDECVGGQCNYENIPGCCHTAADCPAGGVCEQVQCVSNACSYTDVSGCCVSSSDCSDGNTCTTDTCENNVCVHTNNTASCNDFDSCTTGDTCSNGSCSGTPVECPAGEVCVGGSCKPEDPCAGQDECTENDTKCVGNSQQSCADHDGDGCLEWGGTTPCGAGQVCSGEACTACGESGQPCCVTGDPCPGSPTCQGGTCVEPTDPCAGENCNDHGYCSNGSCICDPGYDAGSDCGACAAGYKYYPDCCQDDPFCSDDGKKRCAEDKEQTCSDYDDDACLEWTTPASCGPGEICSSLLNNCTACGDEGQLCCAGNVCPGLDCQNGTCVEPGDPCDVVSCGLCEKCSSGSCVADTSKNGTSCDGQYGQCKNGSCCACPDGPCCAGCGFLQPWDDPCDEGWNYKCSDSACGGVGEWQYWIQSCSGTSPECEGEVDSGNWEPMPNGACAETEVCKNSGTNAWCEESVECDCQPKTCNQLGKECGSWSDGCGGTKNCGSCGSFEDCIEGSCELDCPAICDDLGYECGQQGNCHCGNCPPGKECKGVKCKSCPEYCAGCCDGTICKAGTSTSACGKNGLPCQSCDDGSNCTEGDACSSGSCVSTEVSDPYDSGYPGTDLGSSFNDCPWSDNSTHIYTLVSPGEADWFQAYAADWQGCFMYPRIEWSSYAGAVTVCAWFSCYDDKCYKTIDCTEGNSEPWPNGSGCAPDLLYQDECMGCCAIGTNGVVELSPERYVKWDESGTLYFYISNESELQCAGIEIDVSF